MQKIYVQLLGEGTIAYKPVDAIKVTDNVYQIQDDELYDPNDEEWEFAPGTSVIVEEQILDGDKVLVAIRYCN